MKRALITLLLLCSICAPAAATTVLRWVDADGITHFSDTPPVDDVGVVTALELDDSYPPVAATDNDYYSIANQWNRMREEREAKTKLTLEKARIRASEAAAAASTEPVVDYYAAYYPAYILPYRHHRDRRPGLHPRRDRSGLARHHVAGRGHRGTGGTQGLRSPSRRAMRPLGGRRSANRGIGGVSHSFNFR